MRHTGIISAFILLAFSAVAAAQDGVSDHPDLKRLEGSWRPVKVWIGPGVTDATALLGGEITISGTTFRQKRRGHPDFVGRISRLDSSRETPELELTVDQGPSRGNSYRALYSLKDDTFELLRAPLREVLPAEFRHFGSRASVALPEGFRLDQCERSVPSAVLVERPARLEMDGQQEAAFRQWQAMLAQQWMIQGAQQQQLQLAGIRHLLELRAQQEFRARMVANARPQVPFPQQNLPRPIVQNGPARMPAAHPGAVPANVQRGNGPVARGLPANPAAAKVDVQRQVIPVVRMMVPPPPAPRSIAPPPGILTRVATTTYRVIRIRIR